MQILGAIIFAWLDKDSLRFLGSLLAFLFGNKDGLLQVLIQLLLLFVTVLLNDDIIMIVLAILRDFKRLFIIIGKVTFIWIVTLWRHFIAFFLFQLKLRSFIFFFFPFEQFYRGNSLLIQRFLVNFSRRLLRCLRILVQLFELICQFWHFLFAKGTQPTIFNFGAIHIFHQIAQRSKICRRLCSKTVPLYAHIWTLSRREVIYGQIWGNQKEKFLSGGSILGDLVEQARNDSLQCRAVKVLRNDLLLLIDDHFFEELLPR